MGAFAGNARLAAARIASAAGGIAGERVPSLLRLETAVVRKLEALPSSAPVDGRFLPDFPPLRSLARRYPEIQSDQYGGRMWLPGPGA